MPLLLAVVSCVLSMGCGDGSGGVQQGQEQDAGGSVLDSGLSEERCSHVDRLEQLVPRCLDADLPLDGDMNAADAGEAGAEAQADDSGQLTGDAQVDAHVDAAIAPLCAGDSLAAECMRVDDFDVAADGRMALVRRLLTNDRERLELRCANPATQQSSSAVVIDLPRGSIDTSGADEMVNVRVANASGAALVTFVRIEDLDKPYTTRRFHSRLYDAQCRPLTDAFAWPSPTNGESMFDVAMDAQGRFALAWAEPAVPTQRVHVSLYDAQGVKTGSDLVMNPSHDCDNMFRVALHPSSGAGAVSCQGHYYSPIYLRRFSAGHTWLDAQPVRVDEGENASSWYESHILAMNERGETVVQWQRYWEPVSFRARLFGVDGTPGKALELGAMRQGYDAFRSRHVAPLVMANDFLLFDDFEPGKVWRISASGERLGCDRVASLVAGSRLRGDGQGRLYVRDASDSVRLVDVDFTNGCPD